MDNRNRPRNCADWQKILVGIANRIEPMDPYEGTMARQHALRCEACWWVHLHAVSKARREGIAPTSTIIPLRVLMEQEIRHGPTSDPTVN